ncbi:hypothetical protein GH714_039896 [Hevea brasiliensis]|uniref:DUF7731 domain-containing protein n=1 Tax=Hevea brasiliensis TaxID=3981 RepID=A0A6A6M3Q5_HEVBR|nr:hypothetical protein GH714_039896 [Hevea brasiliensis]
MFCCNLGKAYGEEVPQKGTGLAGYDPFTGVGVVGDEPHTGTDDFLHARSEYFVDLHLAKSQIYSSCEEAYRLTESGDINVPHEYVDQYCNGPCLSEVNLVLNCIENIMTHFVFYNKATIQDIKDTIKAGCSYGPERGDFNVAEHLQAQENRAYMNQIQIVFGLGFMITGHALLL